MSYLLGCESHAVRRMHRLEHVFRKSANLVVHFVDSFPFRAQNRVPIFPDRQLHFPSRVNAGRFFTPASFNASITLIIVPNDDFLSACKARVARRVAGKLRTEVSNSSSPITWPSSRTSSFSF